MITLLDVHITVELPTEEQNKLVAAEIDVLMLTLEDIITEARRKLKSVMTYNGGSKNVKVTFE